MMNYNDFKVKLKKRAPVREKTTNRNDIYVSRKSKYHALLSRGKMLLEQAPLNSATINIHGLGAAVNTAVDLALELQKHFGGPSHLKFSITTETVPLVDDFYSRDYDEEFFQGSQVRFNSAIHIQCTRSISK